MKILITGVAGFIGSNLAEALLAKGHDVYGIDNLSYGELRNIEPFLTHEKFHFHSGDICNPFVIKEYKVDLVVHLASQKIPRYSSAFRTLDENQIMLRNIVAKCQADKSKLLFASTSDVYGKNKQVPFTEESDLVMGPPTVKRWAYAISKMYSEQTIVANHDEFDLNYTIVRFFGSYGPNQNLTWWGGPQSLFISRSARQEALEIHGDGLQTRTFTYIKDTVAALVLCIESNKSDNEIFNIASDPSEEITIAELGRLIWKLVNGDKIPPQLNMIPYSSFGKYEDVQRRVPSIDKLISFFGYKPRYTLAEGLKETIEWQRKIEKW